MVRNENFTTEVGSGFLAIKMPKQQRAVKEKEELTRKRKRRVINMLPEKKEWKRPSAKKIAGTKCSLLHLIRCRFAPFFSSSDDDDDDDDRRTTTA